MQYSPERRKALTQIETSLREVIVNDLHAHESLDIKDKLSTEGANKLEDLSLLIQAYRNIRVSK